MTRAAATLKDSGFLCEQGDPSVGIFGDFWYHDSCEQFDADEPTESEVTEETIGYEGTGVGRMARVRMVILCPDCGASATTEYADWDPEYPDDDLPCAECGQIPCVENLKS